MGVHGHCSRRWRPVLCEYNPDSQYNDGIAAETSTRCFPQVAVRESGGRRVAAARGHVSQLSFVVYDMSRSCHLLSMKTRSKYG